MNSVDKILIDENESPSIKAVRRYESLYLLNEICKYQLEDPKSKYYKKISLEKLIKVLSGFESENHDKLKFESNLIEKYLNIKSEENEIIKISDIFLSKNKILRKSDLEIDQILKPLKEVIKKYEPLALKYTHIKYHHSQLTLDEYSEIAKNELKNRNLIKDNDLVNYDKLKEKLMKEESYDLENKEYHGEINWASSVSLDFRDSSNEKSKPEGKVEYKREKKINRSGKKFK